MQELSCEKGRIVAYSYILYYSILNVYFCYVNNKFCNKNLVSDWVSVVLIFSRTLYRQYKLYRSGSI